MAKLEEVASGVHCVQVPQGFFGLELGTRMTVLETSEGPLVHAPAGLPKSVLGSLGSPRWVVAPNLWHHLYIGGWMGDGVESWAAPGLAEKRTELSFSGTLDAPREFGGDVLAFPLKCIPFSNEVLFLHRPSRTLVVTDLLFNLRPDAPWLTRMAMGLAGAYPGPGPSLVERLAMKRAMAREELRQALAWDFDRLVMAHGAIVETGAKDVLAKGFTWLGL